MVAARKNRVATPRPAPSRPSGATNIVRRTKEASGVLVDARVSPRIRVAQRAWLCGADGSIRGYALDLSVEGGRFGGAGTRLEVGATVIVKLVLDEREAPLTVRAQVVRYAPALHCPELCMKFVDFPDDDARARLRSFIDARR
jgi:hypothetical protein